MIDTEVSHRRSTPPCSPLDEATNQYGSLITRYPKLIPCSDQTVDGVNDWGLYPVRKWDNINL